VLQLVAIRSKTVVQPNYCKKTNIQKEINGSFSEGGKSVRQGYWL